MILSQSANPHIGLDISDFTIKAVQLKKKGKRTEIQSFCRKELDNNIIEDGEIINEEEVSKAINSMLSKPIYGQFSTKDVVVCLPETKTFIKLITVHHNLNDISKFITNEIEKYVPMSINDVYYDWQIMETFNDKSHVLIGVSPKNIADQYLSLLKKANLNIIALEIEPAALARSLLREEMMQGKNNLEKNYAIIDIGAKRTSMIIYSHNTIVLSISMPLSGDEITNKISETLDIKKDQAEKAKIICGVDKSKAQGIIADILSDTIRNLNQRIKSTLEFYDTNYGYRGNIEEIILCGGGSNINDINEIIAKSTGIKTSMGDPFINISHLPKKIKDKFIDVYNLDNTDLIQTQQKKTATIIKQNSSLKFATAIGLALRNIR